MMVSQLQLKLIAGELQKIAVCEQALSGKVDDKEKSFITAQRDNAVEQLKKLVEGL